MSHFNAKRGEFVGYDQRRLCSTGIEIALVVAAVAGAAASLQSAKSQADAANAAAGLSRFQAKQAEVQGILEGNEILRSANRTEASNLARFGAAGIDLGSGGVPEQVNAAVRRDAEHQLKISRLNSRINASGLTLQASEQARAARAARVTGFLRAGSGLASAGITAFG